MDDDILVILKNLFLTIDLFKKYVVFVVKKLNQY